jgi:glycosyltransferase involved in cell wall biosynthesis
VAIALDATYSLGSEPSGVGVYSREILYGLASAHPEERFFFCYRPHRLLRSFGEALPVNVRRRVLGEAWLMPPRPHLFHGLNQRMPSQRMRRSVCTFHDLFVMTGEYSTREFRERFTAQARYAAGVADLIIAVSEFTAGQVRDLLGVEPDRLRVVHHGIRTLPDITSERRPLVLSVGAVQARKNTARLIAAFEHMPADWELVLAGSPSGFQAEEILARIASSPARPRIRVTGYVKEDELARLYSQASVFAFPSLDEGFGMPVLEAMSHGVPVIASNRAALPEVCGGAALLVNPEEIEDIAAALVQLATNPELRRDLAGRGRHRAQQFTWTAAVQATWNVYRELI